MKRHQRRICKKSVVIATLVSVFAVVSITTILASASAELSSVQHLLPYLKLDDAVTFISKLFGQIIFTGMSKLNNLVENSFMHIATLDLFALVPDLGIFESRISSVISSLFMMTFAGFILVRMFQQREMGSIFTNAIIVGMSILLFTNFVSLADEGRVVLTNFIDESIGENMTTTDLIFLDNTYDLKYLISEANNGNNIVVTLRDQGFTQENIQFVSWDERLSKDVIGEKYIMNGYTSEKEVANVRDGMWGIGDERYFRYHISYAKINSGILLSFFVYTLAGIKGSFIVYDFTLGRFFGKWASLRGIGDFTEVAKPYVFYIQSIASMLILVILVSIYPVISSTVFSLSEEQMPILVKLILLFVAGITILYGSDFINSVLGFEGARRTLLTSMMLKRGAKSLYKGAKAGADGVKNMFDGDGTKGGENSQSGGSNTDENEHSKPDSHGNVSNKESNNLNSDTDVDNKANHHNDMDNHNENKMNSDTDQNINQNMEDSPHNDFSSNVDDRDNFQADNNMDDDNPQILSNKHMYGFQSKDDNDEHSKPDNHSFNDDNDLNSQSYPTEDLTFKNGDFVSSNDEDLYKNHMNDFSKEYGNLFENQNSKSGMDEPSDTNNSKKRKR